MVKRKLTHLILTLALVSQFVYLNAQEGITYRFAVSNNTFIREPGSSDAIANSSIPVNNLSGATMNFTSELGLGFEAELMFPINKSFSAGVELERLTLNGYNDNPIYFNYFATTSPPIPNGQEPLVYNTVMNSLLTNIRYYLMGGSAFQPFIKVHGGVGFVGTDLRFKNVEDRTTIDDPLYSRGTKLSTDTKWPIFYFGSGAGFQFQISEKIQFYVDASISIVETDIVDGVPNFSYNENSDVWEHFKTNSIITQVSAGICYATGEKFKLFQKKSEKSSRAKKRKGKIHEFLPFYEIKK